jgi:hypothetical protein
MRKKKVIAVCSSVTFYKDVVEIEKQLKKLGYIVFIPDVAKRMGKSGDFDEVKQKIWYKDPTMYKLKTKLMRDHFKKIVKSDAILVINKTKNNIPGYIGGNTLMEISIAFHYKKPVFILNPIADTLSIKEEIYGVFPTFLNGDITTLAL